MNQSASGSCLCRRVLFHFDFPSLWCSHCHCSMCRKAHGAGYVTWVGVNSNQFSIDQGESHLRWYNSSPGASRGSCDVCGSIMLFQSQQWSGEMHIAVGTLDDEIDRQPAMNAYFDTHVSWMPIDTRIKSRPLPIVD